MDSLSRPELGRREQWYITGYGAGASGLRPTYWPGDLAIDLSVLDRAKAWKRAQQKQFPSMSVG